MDYPTGDTANLVDRSLITGEVCDPPCWQGIVPGETTSEEALSILNEAPFVDNDSIVRNSPTGRVYLDMISWNSPYADTGHFPTGRVKLNFRDDTVLYVFTVVEYELTVQDMLDRFGEPDNFQIMPSLRGRCYAVALIWLSPGLEAKTYTIRGGVDKQLISSETLIMDITYFEAQSSIEELLINVYERPKDRARIVAEQDYADWNGFESVKLSTN